MIGTSTQYGKLKRVVVGKELNFSKRLLDITTKSFYKSNLGQEIYESPTVNYNINYNIIQERHMDLNNLENVLVNMGIDVIRPDNIDKLYPIQTPTFKTELSAASNVRDLIFVYNNTIIETPVFTRNRYFENMQLLTHLKNLFYSTPDSKWYKAPFNLLSEDSIDLKEWDDYRDFSKIDYLKYDMAIDAAQFIKINEKECFVNISTYNHELGYQWIKSCFPDITFYPLYQLIDNHLDGAFNILNDGTFLVNPKYPKLKERLPEKFKNWKYLYPIESTRKYPKDNTTINALFASERGMDINVLSVSPTDVIVSDQAFGTIEILEQNKFNPVPIQFRHSEIFAGGIHCSTLDVKRD